MNQMQTDAQKNKAISAEETAAPQTAQQDLQTAPLLRLQVSDEESRETPVVSGFELTGKQQVELSAIGSKRERRARRQEMLDSNRHIRSVQAQPSAQNYADIKTALQTLQKDRKDGVSVFDDEDLKKAVEHLQRADTLSDGILTYSMQTVDLDNDAATQIHLNLLQSMLGMVQNDLTNANEDLSNLEVRIHSLKPPFAGSLYRLGDELLRARQEHKAHPNRAMPLWHDLLTAAGKQHTEDVSGQQLGKTGANLSTVLTYTDRGEKHFFKSNETTTDLNGAFSTAVDAQMDLSDQAKAILQAQNGGAVISNLIGRVHLCHQNNGDEAAEVRACLALIPGIQQEENIEAKLATIVNETLKHCYTTSNAAAIGIGRNEQLTGRNIATTKLSELLGMPELLVRSEFVTLHMDKGDLQGYSMARAAGQDYTSLPRDPDKVDILTGNFQRQLVMLQVFDNIIGQMDRHLNNTFYNYTDTGGTLRFDSISGIDNDLCCGTAINVDKKAGHQIGCVSNIYAQQPQSNLPCMDAELYRRLKLLTPEVLRANMTGLMSGQYIDAMIQRLELVTAAMDNSVASAQAKGSKFLYEPDEWGDKTLGRLTSVNRAVSNYVQRFNDARTNDIQNAMKQKRRA